MAKAISNILNQGSAVRVENYPYHLTDTLVKVLIPDPLTVTPILVANGSGISPVHGDELSIYSHGDLRTCFFRCKSRDHLSFYRRSDQKGDRIVIGYYRIVIKYYSVAPQRRACGRDPPKKKKKIKHYMLCLLIHKAQESQINSLQLSNNIL